MSLEMEERIRRSITYKTFDKLLRNTHGGDFIEMHSWIMSKKCIDQFETKFKHDQFVNDFVSWSRNRNISFE